MQISPQLAQPVLQPVPDLPPEPHCHSWYSGSPCDVLQQQYQAAVTKQANIEFQNRIALEKSQAARVGAAEAAAPLQQRLSDLQAENTDLQNQVRQLQSDLRKQESNAITSRVTSIQAKEAAHDEGFREGLLQGGGTALGFILLIVGIWYLVKRAKSRYHIVRRDESARGVSA